MNNSKKPNAIYNFLTKDNGKYSKYLAVFLILAFIAWSFGLGILYEIQHPRGQWFR